MHHKGRQVCAVCDDKRLRKEGEEDMSIANINNMLVNAYQYAERGRRTESGGDTSFLEKLNGETDAAAEQRSEVFPGDMVIPQPPTYNGFQYNSNISNKTKDEMTLDEYKQWFRNEVSQMPVSSWVRSSFSSGALVIKEEAFERMKNDPEYEKYVLNRVRSYYSASSGWSIGSNNVSYEVIGASPEECYGYAGPAGNSGSIKSGDDESWWKKRHERLEEILEEQAKKAQMKRATRREQRMQEWEQQAIESRQRMAEYFNSRAINSDVVTGANVSPQMVASAVTAYDKSIMEVSGNSGKNII